MRVDVLALQVPLMNSTEARSFISSARQLGYAAYMQPGKPTVGRWGEERQWAGVALLVRAELKSRVHVKLDSSGGQAILLWVGGLLFGSCYAAQNEEVDEFLTELATEVAALGPDTRWVLSGDWNLTVQENPLPAALQRCPAGVLRVCDVEERSLRWSKGLWDPPCHWCRCQCVIALSQERAKALSVLVQENSRMCYWNSQVRLR